MIAPNFDADNAEEIAEIPFKLKKLAFEVFFYIVMADVVFIYIISHIIYDDINTFVVCCCVLISLNMTFPNTIDPFERTKKLTPICKWTDTAKAWTFGLIPGLVSVYLTFIFFEHRYSGETQFPDSGYIEFYRQLETYSGFGSAKSFPN